MSIPGLFRIPVEETSPDAEVITLTGFDMKPFTIPDSHRYGKCRPVTEFDKICKLGEGTFGAVYKVKDKVSNEIVALKKLKISKDCECMPLNYTREITILKMLRHENIVNVYNIAVGKSIESTYLVLEYCSYVLSNLIDEVDTALPHPQIKCIMHQLFAGLDYVHKHFVIHRDLNVTNILFTVSGILKISDFGCSRKVSSGRLTPNVVSRWYRPPEILFGSEHYTTAVDMWSAGCVFAELFLRKPLFRADSDADLIKQIIDCLSTPTESMWPGYSELPLLKTYDLWLQPKNRLRSYFEEQTPMCIALLHKLFLYNPDARFTAEECLTHAYFTESPVACTPESLVPTLMACSSQVL